MRLSYINITVLVCVSFPTLPIRAHFSYTQYINARFVELVKAAKNMEQRTGVKSP